MRGLSNGGVTVKEERGLANEDDWLSSRRQRVIGQQGREVKNHH